MISSSDCQRNMHLEVEEPNLIPLLDFMLVLLVMFVMLAGPIQQVMKLNLPDVSQAQTHRKPDQSITVYVENKKHFKVNGKNFNSIATLTSYLQQPEHNKDQGITIAASKTTDIETMLALLAINKKLGVKTASIQIDKA